MISNFRLICLVSGRATATASSLALLVALGACGKKDDGQTVGQKLDSAMAKTEQAATEAKLKTEASTANSGDTIKEETQKAEAAGKTTAASIRAAVDDIAITASVSSAFAKDADFSAIKINVDTKNAAVTLSQCRPTTRNDRT